MDYESTVNKMSENVSLAQIRHLRVGEESLLLELERAAWPKALQASMDLIRRRIGVGHCFLVAEGEQGFQASACFVHTSEDPTDTARFPTSFEAFSTLPKRKPVLSTYVYNLCVHPSSRGSSIVRRVGDAVIAEARNAGSRYLVGDGRCPSYAGAQGGNPDTVRLNQKFRTAIDRWRLTGIQPSDADLVEDPVLRFYKRILDCRFLHLAADFCPQDAASGGHRVIFAKVLVQTTPESN